MEGTTNRQVLAKLDDIEKRLARIETRLCVFMESKGVAPRLEKEKEKKNQRPALTSGIFNPEWW